MEWLNDNNYVIIIIRFDSEQNFMHHQHRQILSINLPVGHIYISTPLLLRYRWTKICIDDIRSSLPQRKWEDTQRLTLLGVVKLNNTRRKKKMPFLTKHWDSTMALGLRYYYSWISFSFFLFNLIFFSTGPYQNEISANESHARLCCNSIPGHFECTKNHEA